ncbi:GPI-anchored surface protein, putative [Bodo saltans]|uniref:GPI-anchored surface protein, putative n=1 Tax=Bodo saltans TaxID=75058 RepID=A0A0S4IS03_BODSA|nr:GPI-anchored surface protein, putative [Bodo saltans]|eukprot:CUF52735.1 GPI-anchored surface protein, putative [Bodo saltans]
MATIMVAKVTLPSLTRADPPAQGPRQTPQVRLPIPLRFSSLNSVRARASTQKPLLAGYDNADILDSVNSFAASTTTVNAWTAPITPLNVSPHHGHGHDHGGQGDFAVSHTRRSPSPGSTTNTAGPSTYSTSVLLLELRAGEATTMLGQIF